MATQYDTDATVKTMVDNYDWYIVPSLNVDGYEFTWTNVRNKEFAICNMCATAK